MPDFSNIKAVVFDAVGTVIYPDPPVAQAYQSAIKEHCRIDVDLDTIASALRCGLADRSTADDLRTDEEAEHQFWADLIHKLCPDSAGFDDCFYHLFDHFQQSENWRCFSDVEPTLVRLKERGLTIGIASNFDRRLDTVCDGLVDLAAADVRVISSVVGWRKPAPQFFQAVMDILKLPAEQIMFVGDDVVNDVNGALALGMPAVLINRRDVAVELPPPAIHIKTLAQVSELLQDENVQTEKAG